MKILKKLLSLFLLCYLSSCTGQPSKINGVSFVASNNSIAEKHITPITKIHTNFVAIMPFGFVKNLQHPNVIFNTKRQWYGETSLGVKQYVTELKKKQLKIMLKPQLWIWQGEYTGFLKMDNENDWKVLEKSYSIFILEYAELAQSLKIELFCIGTELEQFVLNRPEYWNSLIKEIKKRYKGKLTYASNWNEYAQVPFWKLLDYIGVDAYFPVNENKTPSVDDCKKGWEKTKNTLKSTSNQYKKPILFTEFGYRSVDFTAKEPWKSDRKMNVVNLQGQLNATQAIFETFWNENWFAGGFLWKWHHNHKNIGGLKNSQFTPQNKPVEKLIKHYYKISN